MPDLLASTSLLPLTPAIPSRAPVAAPAAADFLAMLGELVLPPGAKQHGGKGQALAGDGKDLPVEGETAGGDEDEAEVTIAWLPAGLVPLQPIEPVPLPEAVPIAGALASLPAGPAPLPAGEGAVALTPPDAMSPTPPSVAQAGVVPAPETAIEIEGEAALADMPSVVPEIESGPSAETPIRDRLPRPASAPLTTPQPVVQGAVAAPTAGQVFAAAMSASLDSPLAPAPRTIDAPVIQNQAAAEQLRTTVQAMSDADQPPLDLSRDDWTGKMVDRIATLRDAAEAGDTRIRLAPENLGNVEVSIRRDGDRLHVHFAAENPATRQLLAEAAPRLAELADARGVKLGQTSVDAGTGGQQESRDQSRSNRPARVASADMHIEPDQDDRIA